MKMARYTNAPRKKETRKIAYFVRNCRYDKYKAKK